MSKDQCGNEIPHDLVLLPPMEGLTKEEIKWVDNADWYEARGVLMASAEQLHHITEDDPLDAGVKVETDEILYIARILHRYDGVVFYHA